MTKRWAINQDDMREQPEGCQSTSHKRSQCWGDLWQCSDCRRHVCYADGVPEDELCDACWARQRDTAILQPTVQRQVEADGDMVWA